MRKLLILIATAMMVALLASPAFAHHVSDGGVDEAWSEEMNQETYWESRFGSDTREVSCTKFSNHSGHIPAEYDAAVVKDGNMVRVYADLTEVDGFTALGAINPANGKHFDPPHSWVMKCKFVDTEEPETAFWCVDGEVVESEEPPAGDSVTGPFGSAEEAGVDCVTVEPPPDPEYGFTIGANCEAFEVFWDGTNLENLLFVAQSGSFLVEVPMDQASSSGPLPFGEYNFAIILNVGDIEIIDDLELLDGVYAPADECTPDTTTPTTPPTTEPPTDTTQPPAPPTTVGPAPTTPVQQGDSEQGPQGSFPVPPLAIALVGLVVVAGGTKLAIAKIKG